MKSYREIADSVFARREQYVIAQRKKKQAITRVTASVGSVALVSLAGFALFKNDSFREKLPVSDGNPTTTTITNTPTEIGDTTTANNATATTTDGGIVAPTTATTTPSKTQPPATTPSKTEPSKTTAPTTVPKKQLIGASEPDTYSVDNANEGGGYFKRGEISPMLKESMEIHKDEDVVFSVLVAVMPKFNGDDLDKAVSEFCETEEMRKLAEENNWEEYDSRVHDFRDARMEIILKEELDALRELSEIAPIKHLPDPRVDRYNPETGTSLPFYVVALASFSFKGHHIYSVVLSADAINEFAERGTAMFWLDSPDIVNEKISLPIDD